MLNRHLHLGTCNHNSTSLQMQRKHVPSKDDEKRYFDDIDNEDKNYNKIPFPINYNC